MTARPTVLTGLLTAGVLATALLAAGCGGGGSAPGSAPGATTGGADGTGEEATVGTVGPDDLGASPLPDDETVTLLPDDGAATAPPLVGDLTGADLTVEVVAGGSGSVRLTCSFEQGVVTGDGDHPDVDGACADLQAALAEGDPFAPVPPDRMCTQQYGGDAVAVVRGTLTGVDGAEVPVDSRFQLTDGCEIDRWERMGRVLEPYRGGPTT